jgi:hypothetical protein
LISHYYYWLSLEPSIKTWYNSDDRRRVREVRMDILKILLPVHPKA